MNIKHMKYFLCLYDEKNYSRAAELLGITQPTLSQTLQKLETVLGTPLFDRSVAPFALTPAGEVFLNSCRSITGAYDRMLQQIGELERGLAGSVTLGIAPFRAQYFLPSRLREFRAGYPGVRVQVREMITDELFAALDSGELDFLITAQNSRIPDKYVSVPISEEKPVIAVSNNLIARDQALKEVCDPDAVPVVDFSLFRGMDFILLGDDQLLYKYYRALSEETGVNVNAAIRCTEIETSLALADADAGAAFALSTGLVYYRKQFPHLCYFEIKSGQPSRTVYLVYRKNQTLSQPAGALIKFFGGET